MYKIKIILISSVLLINYFNNEQLQAQKTSIKHPEDFFGFEPGSDGMLFNYEKLISYLQNLDALSNRMEMVEIGKSPMGKSIYVAFISSEGNIARLDELKEINKNLAINPYIPEAEYKQYIDRGRVFVLATLSMHSAEVGPSQSAALIAYELITTQEPEKLKILQDVVYMMVPCHNPDGMDMIVENYLKYKGTKYEGSTYPGIYHKYVGHDINRDFITLSQEDTRAISLLTSKYWFPQVLVQKHQMGSSGPRYFVPPNHDPIAENIDAEMWNWTSVFGSNMIKDMTKAACKGVSQHYLFDNYWPGSTETSLWKNVISLLTEAASVKTANPVYIESNELVVNGKGLSEYKKSINMPEPWEGGWWRLSDIIRYEKESTYSILKTASSYREEILRFRNELCKREIEKGRNEAPYYYIFPAEQHDEGELYRTMQLLIEHGIDIYRLIDFTEIDHCKYAPGDFVIPLAQSFRSFIKEVLESQDFPLRHYTPRGEIIKPYDITSWSLPLHRGLKVKEINVKLEDVEKKILKMEEFPDFTTDMPLKWRTVILLSSNNESYAMVFKLLQMGTKVERIKSDISIDEKLVAAGSFVIKNISNEVKTTLLDMMMVPPVFIDKLENVDLEKLSMPRIGLVETYYHDIDAGWTRYMFDTYNIPFTLVRPEELSNMEIADKFDMLVFPDSDKEILLTGKRKNREGEYITPEYPPEFTKGIGKKGKLQLFKFIDQGGTVLSWGNSTGMFMGNIEFSKENEDKNAGDAENVTMPVSDITKELEKDGLYCPGSLLGIKLKSQHELTYGMESTTGVFFRGKPVFKTTLPVFNIDRRVIAWYIEDDVLLSGYIEKAELIAGKPAMVWVKKGKGQIVLYAFNPQFRASTSATYKLLFNALLMGKVE